MPHFRAAAFGLVPAGVNEALKPGLNGGVDGPLRRPIPLVDQAQILFRHYFETVSRRQPRQFAGDLFAQRLIRQNVPDACSPGRLIALRQHELRGQER